jgi:RimJ/RimL family protein N-acetyltransferase
MLRAMTADPGERPAAAAGPKSVRFVRLTEPTLSALLDGDLTAASAAAGVALTGYFLTPEALRLWQLRANQTASDPGTARWIARAAVAEPDGVVVGHAGFHGPPDAAGMVEVAYSVDPAHRRQGYATAMLRELLRRAAAEPGVTTVRATISPDNAASLATIAGFGFTRNGEQWDTEDGLELIFERPASAPA